MDVPVQGKGTLFPATLTDEVLTKVKGKSSLTKLSKQMPIEFNGNQLFVFDMPNEVDIVAENGKKGHGGVKVEPKVVAPIKIEYGARVSDEFMIASESRQKDILKGFIDGFAKKMAKGLDIMAMHGINPRTGEASTVIGDNNFDKLVKTAIKYDAANPDENIESAVTTIIAEENEVNGIAVSTELATALAKYKVNGVKAFPEFAWGGNPETVNGKNVDVNATVSYKTNKDRAIVGDFENSFRWGVAKEIPMKIIEYGDPDGSGKDLANYNQIYIRCEAYIGWAIFDEKAFARIEEQA